MTGRRRDGDRLITRDDLDAAIRRLIAMLHDLAGDIDDIDRRARPHGDGTDLDSRRRRWYRPRGRR